MFLWQQQTKHFYSEFGASSSFSDHWPGLAIFPTGVDVAARRRGRWLISSYRAHAASWQYKHPSRCKAELHCIAGGGDCTATNAVMQYLEHLFKPEVYVNILTVGNNWLSFKLNKVHHWIICNVGIRLSINKTNLLPPTLVAEFFLPITIMRGTAFRFSSGIGHNWHKIHHIIRFLC